MATLDRVNRSGGQSDTDGDPHAGATVDLSRADAYGMAFAAVYDRWYGGVTDAEATADFMAGLCRRPGSGRVPTLLELGVGTGRLARPMAERGLRVVGLDASITMLTTASAKAATGRFSPGSGPPEGDVTTPVPLVCGDMNHLPLRVGAELDGVLVAFNTLFNLADETAQARLFLAVAPLLRPGGVIVVEALDPGALAEGPERSLGVSRRADRGVVVSAVTVHQPAQTVVGRHLAIDDEGVTCHPWRLRWLTVEQLDRLADDAGLGLLGRYADWVGAPFHPGTDTHISVYHRRR